MINFTVGPVKSSEAVQKIGSEQVPYFRTADFSELMLENEKLILEFAGAPEESRAVFLTGSGTASMEAAVMNCFTPKDKVLVVVGGSFGERFSQICEIHHIPHDDIRLERGQTLRREDLARYTGKYTGFLVNLHETSTGVLYDLEMVAEFCKQNELFLVVDAISSFLADEINMTTSGIGAMIVSSQKALACPPGISTIILAPSALRRVVAGKPETLYFDLKMALTDGARGQTPFTPAVGILRQIHQRLLDIKAAGGVATENAKIAALAQDFRNKIVELPLDNFSNTPSNAMTALKTRSCSANDIFLALQDEYGIWVCPNGGELKEIVFRVGHIGDLTTKDNDELIAALKDLQVRKILK